MAVAACGGVCGRLSELVPSFDSPGEVGVSVGAGGVGARVLEDELVERGDALVGDFTLLVLVPPGHVAA